MCGLGSKLVNLKFSIPLFLTYGIIILIRTWLSPDNWARLQLWHMLATVLSLLHVGPHVFLPYSSGLGHTDDMDTATQGTGFVAGQLAIIKPRHPAQLAIHDSFSNITFHLIYCFFLTSSYLIKSLMITEVF